MARAKKPEQKTSGKVGASHQRASDASKANSKSSSKASRSSNKVPKGPDEVKEEMKTQGAIEEKRERLERGSDLAQPASQGKTREAIKAAKLGGRSGKKPAKSIRKKGVRGRVPGVSEIPKRFKSDGSPNMPKSLVKAQRRYDKTEAGRARRTRYYEKRKEVDPEFMAEAARRTAEYRESMSPDLVARESERVRLRTMKKKAKTAFDKLAEIKEDPVKVYSLLKVSEIRELTTSRDAKPAAIQGIIFSGGENLAKMKSLAKEKKAGLSQIIKDFKDDYKAHYGKPFPGWD